MESMFAYQTAPTSLNEAGSRHLTMLNRFGSNYAYLIDKLKERIPNIAICTLTPIEEDAGALILERRALTCDVIRNLAREKKCSLIDLDVAFSKTRSRLVADEVSSGYLFTLDGVHLGPRGSEVISEALFEFFITSDDNE